MWSPSRADRGKPIQNYLNFKLFTFSKQKETVTFFIHSNQMARKYVRSGKFIKSTLPKRKYVRSGNHSRLKKAEKKLMLEQMREQAKAAKENGLMNPIKTIPLATS